MKRFLAVVCLGALFSLVPGLRAAEATDQDKAKEALQELNDYIGAWKGNGALEKSATDTWKETVTWTWRFKKDDVWLVLTIKGGKYFKGGELRYLVDKERYQFTAFTQEGKKRVYEGSLKKNRLILERKDPATKETQQLKMNLAGGGIRFIYTFAHKPANRTLFTSDYMVAFTKEGESFGAKEKKIECIVSGGLGKIPVSYKGVTYYVCCSGCKDAFDENPEKFIKEYEAKKKMK